MKNFLLMKYLVSAAFLVGFFSLFRLETQAQSGLIQGTVKHGQAAKFPWLYLWSQQGKQEKLVDSVALDKDGNFKFPKDYPQGFYKLGLKLGVKTTLILGPQPLNKLEASYEQVFQTGFALQNKEMEAWAGLEELKLKFERQMDSLMKSSIFDEFDPRYRSKMNKQEADVAELKLKFNSKIAKLKQEFPNTYVSEVLANFYLFSLKESSKETNKEYDTETAYLHLHYFDLVNFKDPRYLQNPKWEDFIFQYLLRYVQLDLAGFKFGVNHVLQLVGPNEDSRQLVLTYLMDLFAEKGPQEMLSYLAENYASSCESLLKPQTADKVSKLKVLSVGNKAPDFKAPDISMQAQELSKNLGKKATLLLFWSSTCSHCQADVPELLDLYAKYRSKGFEIIAISLDKDYSTWLKFIQEKKLVWLNWSDLGGWKSQVAQLYMVHKTPTAYLLDGQQLILEKEFPLSELGNKLEKLIP